MIVPSRAPLASLVRGRTRGSFIFAVMLAVLVPGVAWAQTSDESTAKAAVGTSVDAHRDGEAARTQGSLDEQARLRGHEGLTAFSQGQFEVALAAFTEAEGLAHSPVFVLYQARASKELGKLFDSRALYQKVAGEELPDNAPETWVRAKADAGRELRELNLLIPRAVVVLEGAVTLPVTVRIDGREIVVDAGQFELESDPGLMTLVVQDSRGTRITRSFAATVGQRSNAVSLAFPRTSTNSSRYVGPDVDGGAEGVESRLNHGALAAFFSSGVSFVSAGVFGGIAFAEARAIKKNCVGTSCLPEDEARADRARRFANLATAGVVVSAVGAVTGISLLLVEPRDEGALGVGVEASLGRLGVVGTF